MESTSWSPSDARTAGMSADPRPPNVLMVVTDQERADILGCYRSPICRTPSLDGLAAEGVRFETCVAPTAICSPSRASLLTGLYPHGHGILNNTHEPDALRTELPPELRTFPELLRDAGYRLGYVGKWHVGRSDPRSRGFHDVASVPADVPGTVGETVVGADPPLQDPIYARYPRSRLLVAGVDPRPIEETETRRDADAAIALLERYAKIEEPFFLSVDFEGPHHPYMPPESYASLYDPVAIPPWPNFVEDLTNKPAAQRRLIEQRGVAGWTWQDWQPVVARYFGFMTFIDAEIGRLLDALERLALRDSTVVMHLVDHGDMTGSHGGQFNKGPLMYDEVLRIPLIIRGPRAARGAVCRAPVGSLAVMPTVLELAGLQPPAGLHVESLLQALADPANIPGNGATFAEYHGDEWGLYSQRMIRTEGAKYVYSPHGMDELYDLETDPHERSNRVDDPGFSSRLAELRAGLIEWMVKTDDPLALWASRLF
jgi:arylsulfatase A-like enzyme